MSDATRTACPYCGVGCGVLASRREDGSIGIKGDPDHPANYGRLCSKGSALGETLSLDDRLLTPTIDGRRASYDEALDLVAARFSETIRDHGPESVAFYVSGQILTEDYYVANKLMKGFIGAANIDTNSRLCMASSVAGHRRAFGSDTVPGNYEDLELADLVVLVGSNLAWCHPVLYQRIEAARSARGAKLIVIDPRGTATSDGADQHLALAPGSDVALFNGLLRRLYRDGRIDLDFVSDHTNGFAAAFEPAAPYDEEQVAAATGLSLSEIAQFYRAFASTQRVVTVYSQGVNQSSSGTDKVNAIINCHLATARIGKPGAGPFSITGQPNAMGGREVGGLANMLAAHMELDNPEHRRIVQSFWGSPTIANKPGLKAVDLFRAVGEGRVKALWIMGTNPVDSMPDADAVRAALGRCPFVVVSDVIARTDTNACAHVLLPSAAWGEKDGSVTNSERRVSRQRAFLEAPGEAMPDWRQMAEVARRMGFGEAFAYLSAADIFSEHAALTAFENDGRRDLDLGAYAKLTKAAYDELAPFQWPQPVDGKARETRFFGDGKFYHLDGRARFVPTPFRAPASATDARFPLVLNTGRIRDQWHTMTRTAKTPRLTGHIGEPFVEIHPRDAAALGLAAADLAIIESPRASAVLRVVVTERQRPGAVFAPMHWTDQYASRARVDALISPTVDPVSGQPELKFTPVAARRFEAAWHGFAISTRRLDTTGADYFALGLLPHGFRAELAGLAAPEDWRGLASVMLGVGSDAEWLAYQDGSQGAARLLAFEAGRLVGALFASREPVAAARTWLAEQLACEFAPGERLALLAGRPGAKAKDRGTIVCACFNVGRNEILEAAAAGCHTVAAIGASVQAGTNCGSCRNEIARLLAPVIAAREIAASDRAS